MLWLVIVAVVVIPMPPDYALGSGGLLLGWSIIIILAVAIVVVPTSLISRYVQHDYQQEMYYLGLQEFVYMLSMVMLKSFSICGTKCKKRVYPQDQPSIVCNMKFLETPDKGQRVHCQIVKLGLKNSLLSETL